MDQLRDPHFDAAWRAASREQPSAALDAAILSAARRATGAGPQPVDVREATRPERWWWPLAAAASIGAVALGILQLVATDRAGVPAAERAIVSDMPAERPPASPRARLPEPSAGLSPAPSVAPIPAPSPAPFPATSGKADARQESAASRTQTSPLRRNDAPRTAAPPAMATTPPPEPAAHDVASAGAKDKAAEARAAAKISGAPVVADAAGARGPRNVSAAAPSAVPQAVPAAPTPPAGGTAAGSPRSSQPFPGGATAPHLMERDAAPPSALGKLMPAPATGARTAERAPLPVAEWIALIRKLRAEGRTAELAREVAAFRAAYPDQQHLLADEPSDGGETPRPPAR